MGEMKEYIYSRHAVHEVLCAKRRQVFSIAIAEGAQETGKLAEIIELAKAQTIQLNRAPRGKLDRITPNHQGVVAEVSGYPYSDMVEILDGIQDEPPFILLLDSLQDPQNFGALIRTAEAVGGAWRRHSAGALGGGDACCGQRIFRCERTSADRAFQSFAGDGCAPRCKRMAGGAGSSRGGGGGEFASSEGRIGAGGRLRGGGSARTDAQEV
jgi:rRNA methylases